MRLFDRFQVKTFVARREFCWQIKKKKKRKGLKDIPHSRTKGFELQKDKKGVFSFFCLPHVTVDQWGVADGDYALNHN